MNKIVRTKLGIDEKRLTRLTLDSEEALPYLKKKIVEEATEVFEAKTKKELCEELGDLLEVIETFYACGIDSDYVKALKTVKLEEKGDFVDWNFNDFQGSVLILDKE